jgi:hypothetical protein
MAKTAKQEKRHAELAPSSHGRWGVCSQSPHMIRQAAIKDRPSQDSAKGTLAHAALAALLAGTDKGMYAIGTKHEIDGYTITVTEDMLDNVQIAIDAVYKLMEKFDIGKEGLTIEEKVRLAGTDLDGTPRSGTLDISLHKPGKLLIIIDYKNGVGVTVDVERNWQLMEYASGKLRQLQDKVKYVWLVVIQPNRMDKKQISTWRTTPEDVHAFETETLDHIVEVVKAPKLVAGPHCFKYFCPVEGQCPARQKDLGKSAELDFAGVNPLPMQMLFKAEFLEPEKIAKLLDVEESVDKYFKAVRSTAKGILEAGGEMAKRLNEAGYHLVEAHGRTKWDDEDAAKAHYSDPKVLGADALRPAPLKPIGEIQKALKKKKLTDDTKEYTIRPLNGVEVAKVDGRSSAPVTAIEDWKGVTIDV